MSKPNPIYKQICQAKSEGRKCFALLIDPDEVSIDGLPALAELGEQTNVDFLFVGGSLLVHNTLSACLQQLRTSCNLPLVLFPGSPLQIDDNADALLFLSLISGRNPELLIGQQVISAPYLHHADLEVIGTGYMLIDGGAATTVSYMSNTTPIPADKPDIAMATALAGEMLGLKLLYMDAGSGARYPISEAMIRRVATNTQIPLIVGGGIRTPERAFQTATAGADVIVVGNAIENDRRLLRAMAEAVHAGAR
ncbi:geranylgeranylglyceryl/heptaprenylglyceryl phosphate synthase [Phaeodactylibacter xiamenensis]|uniref:geranylgeranylglyceryl/heptaprenylglyceryl phosphate synthase n=1 Tax=Phaeodactylibacter xiamenensis TaxID=1524460 RepID=UPI003BA9184F